MLLFFGNDELCSRRAAPATPKWSFLTIKKRLRQAASRGKWCFSSRNAILGKKKRLRQASSQRKMVLVLPNKGATGSPQQRSHWCTPRREPLVHPKKGAIGSPQQRSHWFTQTKEPLVHLNKGTIGSPKGTIGSPQMVQKHQNRHEMVVHGSKSDGDPTKMIRKARSTRIRSSYCAKTLKMRV